MWEVIKEAKKRGCKYYDMWGATPQGKKNHRFSGPSLFKEGFGGERIDWLPASDLPVNFKYWGTYIFENVRKRVRGL
jgi:lipid II:glycine glycyltransferase (peptidoglycan interpeptide bridge formation enzyme)